MSQDNKYEIEVLNGRLKKRSGQQAIFLAHRSPDGDAIGSVFAFAMALKIKFDFKIKILLDSHDSKFELIENIDNDDFDDDRADIIFALDCADKRRAGDFSYLLDGFNIFSVNIDHHVSNTRFANLNIVRPNLSSTCELVYELIKDWDVLNKDIAQCLYTGLINDTGGFRYACTSPRTHVIASELLKHDFNATEIYNKLMCAWTDDEIKLLTIALDNVEINNHVAICHLAYEQIFNITNKSTNKLVSFFKDISDIEIAATITETERNFCKISLRSDYTDVGKIAEQFGGGGHKLAAGCVLKTHALDACEIIRHAIQEFIN